MWAFREAAIRDQQERYGDVALIRQEKFEAQRPKTLAATPAAKRLLSLPGARKRK